MGAESAKPVCFQYNQEEMECYKLEVTGNTVTLTAGVGSAMKSSKVIRKAFKSDEQEGRDGRSMSESRHHLLRGHGAAAS